MPLVLFPGLALPVAGLQSDDEHLPMSKSLRRFGDAKPPQEYHLRYHLTATLPCAGAAAHRRVIPAEPADPTPHFLGDAAAATPSAVAPSLRWLGHQVTVHQ